MRIFSHDTLDSTSTEALRLLSDSTATPFAVWAQAQSAGRGSRSRSWESPRGNLYLSIAYSAPRELLSFMPLITANVLVDFLVPRLTQTPQLKWPNDLLLNGKKFAGILCEAQWQKHDATHCNVVIGIGMNISVRTEAADGEYERECLLPFLREETRLEEFVASLLQHWDSRPLHAWHSLENYERFHLPQGQIWMESSKQIPTFYINEGLSQSGHLIIRNLHTNELSELVSAQHNLQWGYQARKNVRKAPQTLYQEKQDGTWTLAHYASASDNRPEHFYEGRSQEDLSSALETLHKIIENHFSTKCWPLYILGKTLLPSSNFYLHFPNR